MAESRPSGVTHGRSPGRQPSKSALYRSGTGTTPEVRAFVLRAPGGPAGSDGVEDDIETNVNRRVAEAAASRSRRTAGQGVRHVCGDRDTGRGACEPPSHGPKPLLHIGNYGVAVGRTNGLVISSKAKEAWIRVVVALRRYHRPSGPCVQPGQPTPAIDLPSWEASCLGAARLSRGIQAGVTSPRGS